MKAGEHHEFHAGSYCTRLRKALTGDEGNLNPMLRPPTLVSVLFCLISSFCAVNIAVSYFFSSEAMFLCVCYIVFQLALSTGEGSAYERGYPSTYFLFPIAAGSVALAFFIGIKINVIIYTPYHLATTGRSYTDVPPMAKSAIYADAGIIQFSDDAVLDTSKSYGLKGFDYTYCVAPVMSSTESMHPDAVAKKITFWAVGMDCCDNLSNFQCDGAGDLEVRGAFAVREHAQDWVTRVFVPQTARPQYLKAIQAAKALHNLNSEQDDDVLLVRWASVPEDILEVWWHRAQLAVAFSCIGYTVLIMFLWTNIHMYFDRDIQKLAHTKYAASRGEVTPGRNQRQSYNPFLV